MTSLADVTLTTSWAQRDDFVILDVGHGAGFLSTWAAWRADPQRCKRLFYIAMGPAVDLTSTLRGSDLSASHIQAQRLANGLPVLTPGLHTLNFDESAFSHLTLLLGVGDVAELVPQLVAWVDAFDLSCLPPQPPSSNGDHGWLSRLARLTAPGCKALARADDEVVRQGLRQSGFKLDCPDASSTAEPLTSWRFEPHHTPAALAGGLWPNSIQPEAKHAFIVGAGLAGCAAARALARQGWRITLLEALAEPAQAASGNPGGLFHSIVHGADGIHARAHRAAALRTSVVVAPWLGENRFAGQCHGLLRLDTQTTASDALALTARLGLPPDHVQWLDQPQAAIASGLPVTSGGWLFHQGGWLAPAGYAKALLDDAKKSAEVVLRSGRQVRSLRRTQGEEHAHWQALDAQGQVMAEAPVVVLASAIDTAHLIDPLTNVAALPLSSVRGQLSSLPLTEAVKAPTLPVAGAGYVLPPCDNRLLFGATSQPDDADPSVREDDHRQNLKQAQQLGSLTQLEGSTLPEGLWGRVGWRATTPDRLPCVGPLPLSISANKAQGHRAPRSDQSRFIPRLRDEHGGVYVITGLGSRGITWAALAGELLASWVTGSPSPIEAPLRDALDPARFVTRAKAREISG